MIKEEELTPEQVAAYEAMSGIETTGKVTMARTEDPIWDMVESLLVPKDKKKDD